MCLDSSSCLVQPLVPVLICTGFCFSILVLLKLIKKNYYWPCINPGCQVTMATTFCMVASNVHDS